MMSERLEPAASIIDLFGGIDEVAGITGKHRTRVYRWMRPAEKGGTGGQIPQPQIPTLLREAQRRGLELDAAAFFQLEPFANGHAEPAPAEAAE